MIRAPTASPNPPASMAVAARKAAPGVDQATAAGVRVTTGNQMLQIPMPMVAKNSPVAAWASDAPIAVNPARTIAKEAA